VAIQTARFHRHPLATLERCQRTYGDVFTLNMALIGPTVVVAEPEAAAALPGLDPERAHAGEARRGVLPMAAERSVFGGDGSFQQMARGRLAATFAPEAMALREEAMAAIAARHVAAWPRRRPIQLLSRMRTLVDDVFVRLLLGVRDERRAQRMVDALGGMLRTPGNPPVPLPGRGDNLLDAAARAEFNRRKAPLERLLRKEIEARRSGAPRLDDMIGSLLAAEPRPSTEEILGELVTTLMAAQEPPSIALTWMLERLGRHPRLAADFLAAGPGSPLRDAVLSETLRLRPSALASLRKLREPFEAGGFTLPADTTTMVPLPLVHRDPRVFPEPDRFQPRRWFGLEPPSTYLPFGGGARRCIGEALARAEVATVVPTVLETLRLKPLWPRSERMVLRGTVLVPHRSAVVIVD
jgi:cytochrome P450 family 135